MTYARQEVTGCKLPILEIEIAMSEEEEYVIRIYLRPAEIETVVHGKVEYLQARLFLNTIANWHDRPEDLPLRIPDRRDTYMLTEEQFSAYQAFLRRLKGRAPKAE